MSEVLVKKIIDPFRKEENITSIEVRMYSKLINKRIINKDDSDIAKDIYNQLIDSKDYKNKDIKR